MKELYIIDNHDNSTTFALLENKILIEYYVERNNNKSIEGNIYIGKVQNIIPGLQSAFVNIGEKRNAFIHARDILPKIDLVTEKKGDELPINKIIKPGDPIIVEVKREAIDKKGPRLSTHINFPGRFIVLLPNSPFITVSTKIEDENEKIRLKEIVQKFLPKDFGAIVRTSASNQSEQALKKDIERIINKWNEITNFEIKDYPKKIYDRNGILEKTLIDLADFNLEKIYTNSEEHLKYIKNIQENNDLNIKSISLNQDFTFDEEILKQIKAINNNKIWLKSGGFIVIDKTEALYAIDVNSGKYIGKKDINETVLNINLEACKEIAKQLRLKDISGIIIIDFIDMNNEEDKKKVIEAMKKETSFDRSHVQIEEFTKLNLMELTRKHITSKK